MAISTLAHLQNQVRSFLARAQILDTVGADNVTELIVLGEKWLFRKARTRQMEQALNVTISSGVATLPTDYRDLKHARIDGSPTRYLKLRPSRWIMESYPLRSADGKPFYIGVDGANFIFGPYPDSGYTVLGIYYAAPTSVESTANSLFTAHPDLYLFAALAEAEAYVKNDKRVALWIAKRDAILRDVNSESRDAEHDDLEITVA
jgi:hypothetical protein